MTVEHLIRELSKYDKNRVSDSIGWDNIGEVVEEGSTIKVS